MTSTNQFIIRHGVPIVFGAVWLEQLGLPLPALPWLLAAGALWASGDFNGPAGIAACVCACLTADALWFYLGRKRGNQVLNFLCRVSLEPDSCVRRTQNVFTRYGWKGILVAKFFPGLNTITPPLAGMSRMNAAQFFLLDTLGSLLYIGTLVAVGRRFSPQIEKIGAAMASVGGSVFAAVAGLVVVYVGFKFWQRHRILNELRMERITPNDLRDMVASGQNPTILDLRSTTEVKRDPAVIEGAIHLTLDDVKEKRYQISPERNVVVYCSCPNEVTAARVTLLLRKNGFKKVHPLLGGLDAWRDQKFPLGKVNVPES